MEISDGENWMSQAGLNVQKITFPKAIVCNKSIALFAELTER